MFESLQGKLEAAFNKIRGRTLITQQDLDDALKAVRFALLEADVNFKVAKDFCASIAEKSIKGEVHKNLNPYQQIVKICNEELVAVMGGAGAAELNLKVSPPAIILLCGLQGAGKTTSAAKLAKHITTELKRRVCMVSVDVYRPAAIEQLATLAKGINVPVFPTDATVPPVTTALKAIEFAKNNACDTLIIDTAGRLQIDGALMDELKEIVKATSPVEILLVVDAMIGQEAVNVASSFNEAVPVTGMILTKMDGDARGGAALSMRAVTGKPIKFVGISEKADGLAPFHPERMASRILGMGDMMSLIEKATKEVPQEEAMRLGEKLMNNEFTFVEFLEQLKMVKKMGSISSIMSMIPGASKMAAQVNPEQAEKDMKRVEAIILSMTPKERKYPQVLDGSRRKRIASGSGTTPEDINKLVKQFQEMKKMFGMLSKMGMGKGGMGGLGNLAKMLKGG